MVRFTTEAFWIYPVTRPEKTPNRTRIALYLHNAESGVVNQLKAMRCVVVKHFDRLLIRVFNSY